MKVFFGVGFGVLAIGAASYAFVSEAPSETPISVEAAVLAEPKRSAAPVIVAAAVIEEEVVENPTIPAVTLAAAAPTSAAVNAEKEPVLCGIWAVHRLAEEIGIIDQDEPRISDYAHPVPAPVWVINSFMKLARKQET